MYNDEIWKNMNEENIIDNYLISNKGKIKRKDNNFIYSYKSNKNNNYKQVFLKTKNGTKKQFYIHRLVAKYFIKNQNNFNIINHIDGDKQNNCIDNLEWCNQKENMKKWADKFYIKNILE